MSGNPPSLSSSATPSPRRGSTTWSNGPPRWAGRATRSASSTPTSACRAPRSGSGRDSSRWSPRSRWARSGSFSRWRSPGWPATTPPGTGCSTWLVLGMKGIMSEAELHVLRARLTGGIRNKAARGQLRTGLPVGLVWGETDRQIRLHPDEAVTGVIAAVFDRFTVCGSVRATWLWLREQGLRWPLQTAGYLRGRPSEITWVEPTYHAVHTTLTHPGYAGTYVFGRTRQHRYLGRDGQMRARQRRLPRAEWEVLITEHHPGFIDWDTYQANQARIGTNIRPQAREPGTGAVREGCALLQGLATCGSCGRKLAVFYRGPAKSTPGYYCQGSAELVDGRGARHMNVGGQGIDVAVAEAFLAALQPAALQACLAAAQQLEAGHDAALAQHRRQ